MIFKKGAAMSDPRWDPVAVGCRAEVRAEQTPVKILLDGRWIKIDEIIKVWLESSVDSNALVYRMFEAATEEGPVRLRMAEGREEWEIQRG
jgi:hypothetical protein